MDSLLFLASCNGTLRAMDRTKGAVRWTYNATRDGGRPEFHGRPLVTRDLIVIASDDRRPQGTGHLYAFDRSTLAMVWKCPVGRGAMTDILASEETGYLVTIDDEVIAFDLRTGGVQWSFEGHPQDEPAFSGRTPVLVGNLLLVGAADHSVYALDARHGTVLWQLEVGGAIATSMAAAGEDVYVGDARGRMYQIQASTGAVRGSIRIEGDLTTRLVPAGQSLLAFVNEGGTTALASISIAPFAFRWKQATASPGWTSYSWPYVWKHWVIVGRETGEFTALRLEDGQPEWAGRVSGRIAGIGGDETALYLGTTRGTVYSYPVPEEAR